MLTILICLIGGVVYVACPLILQLPLMIANFLIPDPIPFLDEIIMVGGIISKLFFLDDLRYFPDALEDFIKDHKLITIIVVLLIVFVSCIFIFLPFMAKE